MSSISTATATTLTAPEPSAICGSRAQYELPAKDAACGVPNKKEYQSIFDKCAQPAGVRPYYNDCALWSLAVDQSVEKLTKCLYDNGVEWQDVWCHGPKNATATATTYPLPTATGDSSSDTSKDASESSGTASASETKSAKNAGFRLRSSGPTKAALALFGLVLSGALMSA